MYRTCGRRRGAIVLGAETGVSLRRLTRLDVPDTRTSLRFRLVNTNGAMSSQTKSSQMMRRGARVVATELLREPVKQAVREALREETTSVKSTSGGVQASRPSESGSSQQGSSQGSSQQGQSQSGSSSGGRSKLATAALVLAIVGITYAARRRMSSTGGSAWSEPSPGAVATDDADSGYVSEGEMQTAETSDEGGTDTEGTGTSPSTATDQ